ncbi:cysteine proteinase [Dichomitus squalens]|uniref:Ubiquitin carboxyl-terminal hydrolase n=1 Tax=Dichomitus squalens TaxID=114155 RepID=A0A4V2K270_9APHY|nr:cysteine proteinase [Dichomitus squalens]
MPPMNGHAAMHQPASPRINGAGRGRFTPHRGGAPAYHYHHLPPQHHLPPTVPVPTPPPVSPASPFHHPQKFPPHPHPHQVPYGSPYQHPQPNAPYPPAWPGQTLSPLPKQLSMLPPMASQEHVPQLQQHQLPPMPQHQPQPSPQPAQLQSQVSVEATPQASSQAPHVVTQRGDASQPDLTQSEESQTILSQVEEPKQEQEQREPALVADAVPQFVEQTIEEDSVTEVEPRAPTPRSPSPTSAPAITDSSIYVIWSRRPRDPIHAPGVIISHRAFPPESIVQKALELRTPPSSPKSPHAALVQPPIPLVHEASPESSAALSSSTTETTPAGSIAADTPVPGSPYSCATSVSAAIDPCAQTPVSLLTETKIEFAADVADVAPKASEPSTPQPACEENAAASPPTTSAPAPKPTVKKAWNALFASDSAASSSKPRLPVSNVVGFSIPATTGSPALGAPTATANRSELLHLLNEGPSVSSVNAAAAMKIRPRGLVNTGNMCFANAVLQILVYCPPFHRFFSDLKKHLAGPVVGSQREGSKATPLVDATIQFLKEFVPDPPANANVNANPKSKGKEREDDNFDELDSFIPSYVYDAMKEKKRFANMIGGHQEDAEEFLGFYLDTLEEELLSISQSLQPQDAPTAPEEEAHDDGWLEVGKKNKAVATRTAKSTESPITRIFGGKFRSALRAPHQRESVTIEDWRSLQLDIQPENVKTLRDALLHISQPQQVQISIPTRPGALLDAQQQVLIEALPPVLILHMKRFLYDTKVGDVVKVGKQVSFASELDVPPEIISQVKRTTQPVKYQLFGVLYHHGMTASGGHYTLDVLHPNRELSERPRAAWIRIDDELVSDVRPDDVFGGQEREDRQPYLLFYRRMSAWGPARTN